MVRMNTREAKRKADKDGNVNSQNVSPRVKQYNIHWRDELRHQHKKWNKEVEKHTARREALAQSRLSQNLNNSNHLTPVPPLSNRSFKPADVGITAASPGLTSSQTFTLPESRLGYAPSPQPNPAQMAKQEVLKHSNIKVNTIKELIKEEAEDLAPKLKDQTAVTINLIMNPDMLNNGQKPVLGPVTGIDANGVRISSQLNGALPQNGHSSITDEDSSPVPKKSSKNHKHNFEQRMDDVLAEDSVSNISTYTSGRRTPDHLKRYSAPAYARSVKESTEEKKRSISSSDGS